MVSWYSVELPFVEEQGTLLTTTDWVSVVYAAGLQNSSLEVFNRYLEKTSEINFDPYRIQNDSSSHTWNPSIQYRSDSDKNKIFCYTMNF